MAAADVIADRREAGAPGSNFDLPPDLEASSPPEARGLRRDEVRLLVSDVERNTIAHARFADLPRWLSPGDVLVVNTSATVNAAVDARTADGGVFEVHFSTRLPGGFWSVEVRKPGEFASLPSPDAQAGMALDLPGRARVTLLAPYPLVDSVGSPSRLWLAALELPEDILPYLDAHGFPIRYSYVKQRWPLSMYQTIFTTEPGSAEMPSAARPFTPELVTHLVSRGVEIAPLLLHTGVASPEKHEPPYEEYYRVPWRTADRVNAARRSGARIVAVGTTAVRALETVTDECGDTFPGEGWTNLVIGRDRSVRSVNAMITGLHEPRASHLAMLERVAGAGDESPRAAEAAIRHLDRAYAEARRLRYLWHEFGDSHLIFAARAG